MQLEAEILRRIAEEQMEEEEKNSSVLVLSFSMQKSAPLHRLTICPHQMVTFLGQAIRLTYICTAMKK